MTDDELAVLRRHAEVLFRFDADGRLASVNEPDPEPAPRLFLARGRSSRLVLFRHDVPAPTAAACLATAARLPAWDGRPPVPALGDELAAALERDARVTSRVAGPSFGFGERTAVRPADADVRLIEPGSAGLLAAHFPYTRSVLPLRAPVIGVVVDGAVVSACYSARRNADACEAGVDTIEGYRGREYAPAAVAAWRDEVEREGLVPLYSTSWDNVASLAVARKLRLVAYADTLAIA